MNQFSRFELLIGDKQEEVKQKTVFILGLGGVGSYAVEAIVRSGIGRIIIADKDEIDVTNLNRQLMSLHSNIGKRKVDVIKERILDINPDCEVIAIDTMITESNIEEIYAEKIDYAIDACDTRETKFAFIEACLNHHVKFISSMGTGNKFDPSKLKIMDIRKTTYDPLAKLMRKKIKDAGIKDKIMVVSSPEKTIKIGTSIGSTSFVPSVAGLLCASYVINDILKSGEVDAEEK